MGDDYSYPSVDPDLRVCADCFGDDGLKDFVRARRRDAMLFLWRYGKRRHCRPAR